MSVDKFIIDGREIGSQHAPYIVAEMSANHNGRIEQAFAILEAAKKAGADAIKIQTYRADTLTIDCDNDDFKIHSGLWEGKTLYQLYESAFTPWEWHKPLFERASELGITMFSSPFDRSAVDLLEDLNAPAYKIASFELVDIPLIEYVASTGKPLIMSTGMANQDEIAEAVDAARAHGCEQLLLLQCVSAYPARPEDYNLRTMADIQQRFGTSVGLSDHTLSPTTALAAVALGAVLIEKHFTLDRQGGGPDDSFSMEPADLAQLCEQSRTVWQALGSANYQRRASEQDNMVFRRSLYVVKDLALGDVFNEENLKSIRPGYGLAPKHYPEVIGKTANKDIKAGTRFDWSLMKP